MTLVDDFADLGVSLGKEHGSHQFRVFTKVYSKTGATLSSMSRVVGEGPRGPIYDSPETREWLLGLCEQVAAGFVVVRIS
jgi:hypothetical protein